MDPLTDVAELDDRCYYDFGLTDAEAVVVLQMVTDNHFWDQERDGEFLQPQERILRKFEDRLRERVGRIGS